MWLSEKAKTEHAKERFRVSEVQFDEMESIEHTKLKPLTIAMAVSEDYQILDVKVGTIPAKGPLSQIAKKKYGSRKNQSDQMIKDLLKGIRPKLEGKKFRLKSDAKPQYRRIAKEIFPKQAHEVFIARANKEKRRELKYTNLEKRVFDPLFALNQRFAKLRDDIKRLCRRSWCTTKKPENLELHIYLYMAANNNMQFI